MKIDVKENTPQRLEVVLKANTLIYTFVGLLLIAASCWVMYVMGDVVKYEADADGIRYERKLLGIFPREEFRVPADEVELADVKPYGERFPTNELYIRLFDGREQKIWLPKHDGDDKRRVAYETYQVLIGEGDPVRESSWPVGGPILALACFGGGVIALLALQKITISADRGRGQLVIVRKQLLKPKAELREALIADIRAVQSDAVTADTVRADRARLKATSFHVVLRMRKGKGGQIPLTKGPMFTAKGAEDMINLLDGWLNGGSGTESLEPDS